MKPAKVLKVRARDLMICLHDRLVGRAVEVFKSGGYSHVRWGNTIYPVEVIDGTPYLDKVKSDVRVLTPNEEKQYNSVVRLGEYIEKDDTFRLTRDIKTIKGPVLAKFADDLVETVGIENAFKILKTKLEGMHASW